MKKLLIIAALAAMLPLPGRAQKATDVSKRNVTFYMENVEMTFGLNYFFMIKLKNTVPISGYSCKITLPDPFRGMEAGEALIEAYGPNRIILHPGERPYIMGLLPIHKNISERYSPKAWNIFCNYATPKIGYAPMTIPVADEQIFEIRYDVTDNLEPGYYPVTISDQVFSTPNGKVIRVPDAVGYICYGVPVNVKEEKLDGKGSSSEAE